MKTKKAILVILIAILFAPATNAQKASIKRIEQTPDEVIVLYDFEDNDKTRSYFIQLYSSVDNFVKPLKEVSGAVGTEIQSGVNLRMAWNIKRELGDQFVGDLQLEIRGRLYVPFIVMENLGDNKIVKRAKPQEFTWTGDINNEMLNFNLYKNEELIASIPNIPNSGKTQITIPSKTKPGEGYYFVINENENEEHTIKTTRFRIKERVPLLVKLAPAAVVVGVVLLLIPEKKPDVVGIPLDPPSQKK